MKVDFQKYRFSAFILLVVFSLNVVMPTTVLAAGFYCNVESSTPKNLIPAVDCCVEVESTNISELSDRQNNKEHCTLLQSYNHSVFNSLLELESLMPVEKQDKNLLAVSPFFDTHIDADNIGNTISHVPLNVSLPYSTPPIFLLNSTFLN